MTWPSRWIRRVITQREPLPDPRQVLLQDSIRVAGFAEAVLAQARLLNAPDTLDLATGLLFIRMFVRKVEIWIEMEDQA
jgi:hypothetical protein